MGFSAGVSRMSDAEADAIGLGPNLGFDPATLKPGYLWCVFCLRAGKRGTDAMTPEMTATKGIMDLQKVNKLMFTSDTPGKFLGVSTSHIANEIAVCPAHAGLTTKTKLNRKGERVTELKSQRWAYSRG